MDLLKDPVNDRMVKTLKAPPHKPLDQKLLYPEKLKGNISLGLYNCKGKPDWKLLKDHLYREGRLAKEDVIKLVNDTNKVLSSLMELKYNYRE